jgi:hypothetical protein
MSNIADDPSYWLGQSKEMRDMLKSVSDKETREIIEEIAGGYERIAEGIGLRQNSR